MKCKPLPGAAACALVLCASGTALAQTAPTTTSLATPATTEAYTPSQKDADASRRDGGVHIGLLGGVGFPRPLAIEGMLEFSHLIVLGAEYSALPTTNFSGIQTSLWAINADARVFPFHNGFFIGLRVGKQHLSETASVTVASAGTVSGSNTVDTTLLNPRLGFLWSWHAMRIGFDAGLQIPVLSTTTSNLPAGISPPASAVSLSHTLSQEVIPTVDLLRIGVVM